MQHDYLKTILHYDAATGIFVWLQPPKYHPRMLGKAAGCNSTGYTIIRINNKKHKAHRLAWLYVYGELPMLEIDHKDGNPYNNSIGNLRLCVNPQNQANRKRQQGKRLPKGVRRNRDRFVARISFNKELITIGSFSTAQEASDAYFDKARELYGIFARRD